MLTECVPQLRTTQAVHSLFSSSHVLSARPGALRDREPGYLSRSLARHLATMCRQYNDYGSAVRDMDEGNLNSLDFPESNRGRGVAVESDTAVVNDKDPGVKCQRSPQTHQCLSKRCNEERAHGDCRV